MDERFDRIEKMIQDVKSELKAEVVGARREAATKFDVHGRQIAGLSKRIDALTHHQKQFAANFSKRLGKTEAKAQITIEGHEAIRSEMHREFTTLRRDLRP